MAGDWIKMRNNLWDDPRVSACCDATEQSEATIIGGLYWLWSSADEHTVDGHLPGLSVAGIDRKTGIKGFGESLLACGWISDTSGGITICNFTEHNGSSAKKRCLHAKRVGSVRDARASSDDKNQVLCASEAHKKRTPCAAREEKRREEEIQTPIPPSEKKPQERIPNGNGWDLKKEDLRDTQRLMDWFAYTKLQEQSYENEIRVVAASERAMSVGKVQGEPVADKVAYFVSLVRDANWKCITDDDRNRGKLRHTQWSRSIRAPDDIGLGSIFKSPE